MDEKLAVLMLVAMAGGVLLSIISFYLRHRRHFLRHRERMLALEKGANVVLPEAPEGLGATRVYLLRGLIWLFVGFGLSIFLLALSRVEPEPRNPAFVISDKLHMTKRLRELGASEEELKQVESAYKPDQRRRLIPSALALIGLIPAGVGAAYLIFHGIESKKAETLPAAER